SRPKTKEPSGRGTGPWSAKSPVPPESGRTCGRVSVRQTAPESGSGASTSGISHTRDAPVRSETKTTVRPSAVPQGSASSAGWRGEGRGPTGTGREGGAALSPPVAGRGRPRGDSPLDDQAAQGAHRDRPVRQHLVVVSAQVEGRAALRLRVPAQPAPGLPADEVRRELGRGQLGPPQLPLGLRFLLEGVLDHQIESFLIGHPERMQ